MLFRPLSLAALALVCFAGCMERNPVDPTLVRQPTPPRVLRTSPAQGASEVPVHSLIEIEFDEALDPTSVLPSTIRLMAANEVSGKLEVLNGGRTVWFTPDAALAPATAHRLSVHNVKDLQGDVMVQEYVMIFETKDVAPPPISLTGELVFASDRDGNTELYKATADGSRVTRLTFNQGFDGWPVWSPDGGRIVFLSARERSANDVLLDKLDVYVMNADGTNVVRLTTTGYVSNPSWSPDSKHITYEYDAYPFGAGDIATVNADLGPESVKYFGLSGLDVSNPVWSPDGQRIAFLSSKNQRPRILAYKLDGGELETILDPHEYGSMYTLSWFPKGAALLTSFCWQRTSADECDEAGRMVVTQWGDVDHVFAGVEASSSDMKWTPDGKGITASVWLCDSEAKGRTDRDHCGPGVKYFALLGGESLVMPKGFQAHWGP